MVRDGAGGKGQRGTGCPGCWEGEKCLFMAGSIIPSSQRAHGHHVLFLANSPPEKILPKCPTAGGCRRWDRVMGRGPALLCASNSRAQFQPWEKKIEK